MENALDILSSKQAVGKTKKQRLVEMLFFRVYKDKIETETKTKIAAIPFYD